VPPVAEHELEDPLGIGASEEQEHTGDEDKPLKLRLDHVVTPAPLVDYLVTNG